MNRRILTIGLFSLFAILCSCSRMDSFEDDALEEQQRSVIDIISADIEQPGDVKTKTSLDTSDSSYSVEWSEGDEFSLMAVEKDGESFPAEYYTYKRKGDAFSYTGSSAPNRSNAYLFRAVYPASSIGATFGEFIGNEDNIATIVNLPSSQAYVSGGFSDGAYPMVAQSYGPAAAEPAEDFPDLHFKATCGLLQVNLKSALAGMVVKSIVVSADAALNGSFKLLDGIYVHEGEVSDGERSVTLDCGDGVELSTAESKPFFIVLPVGEYAGFKLKVYTDTKVSTFTLKPEKVVKVERSKYTTLNLTAKTWDHRYDVPVGGVNVLSYSEAKSHSNDMADISQIFERNSNYGTMTNFGATGYGKDDGSVYNSVVLFYPTHDAAGNVVWASGRIYFTCDAATGTAKAVQHIVLDDHYTIGSNAEAPSQMYTFDVGIATQKGLVIAPDYLGYGLSGGAYPDDVHSSNVDHPYMAYDLCAENVLDMVRAAKSYMKDNGQIIADATPLYSIGYSQGGGTALGVRRYIENHSLQNEFNLKYTYCGGGVYSPLLFFTSMLNGNCQYPVGLPLLVMGMKAAYPDIVTDSIESYFSDSVVSAGVVDAVRSKSMKSDEISDVILKSLGNTSYTISSIPTKLILSSKALDTSSSQYKNLVKALEIQDLTNGSLWNSGLPSANAYFFHYSKDETVPVAQLNQLKAACPSISGSFESQNYSIAGLINSSLASHRGYAGIYYARMISGAYLK